MDAEDDVEALLELEDADVDAVVVLDAGATTETLPKSKFVTYAYPLDGSKATSIEVTRRLT